MSGPEDVIPSTSKARHPSKAMRILQIVMIWALILGVMVGLAAVIGGVLRDSVTLLDRQLAQMQASTTVATDGPVPVAVAPPPPQVVDGHVITNPTWITVPSPVYPDSALRGMRSGRVALACDAAPDGRIAACTIVEEDPPGAGFGAAALEAARTARLSPRTVDGVPVASEIRFTMRFETGS